MRLEERSDSLSRDGLFVVDGVVRLWAGAAPRKGGTFYLRAEHGGVAFS